MKSITELAPPELDMPEQDGDLLRELAETLTVHNIQQYNTLLKTKDGFADSRRWKEVRRKDGVRVYRERSHHNGLPSTPSLLLLGTIEGKLDDVMYGAVATTDEAIRIKSTCVQDGIIDSKVLHELVQPTVDDPFHHVSVKWRLYNNQRDYVSLDTTGIAHTVKRERIGYNISHSVAFAQIPGLEETHGIERDTLTGHNISQYNTLVVTKDGRADPQRWREVRRRGNVRIYNERLSSTAQCPATPQLLLLGTIEGKLEEIMYGAVATTDEAMRIQSACTKDSVRDSKVLYEIVQPSFHDPFRTVAVKWRLYEGRDYVSLDATGITQVRGCERVGYSISHSVALSDIPSFERSHGIERGNMSVCALYRQKTVNTVECYVRGFFDFNTKNEVLKNMSLQTIATQWSAYARKNTCALAKKLSWRASTSKFQRAYSMFRVPQSLQLLDVYSTDLYELRAASLLKVRRQENVESCDVMPIAREELVGHLEEEKDDDVDVYWARLSSMTVNSSCYSSVVSRQSSLTSSFGSFNLVEAFNRPSLVGRGGSDLT
ncbi:hypothetical protein JG687_00001953 [Phytophthora cactorum]|uniref:START-like domain n=1 Tax=Phytophthora cactorum TaxID=29920 RepID=A0A8T1UYB8_9STRA|nr:hypothetical protein JG687_00001953 [Phytophthora cactorum]